MLLSLPDVADSGESFYNLILAHRFPVYTADHVVLRHAIKKADGIGLHFTAARDTVVNAPEYRRAFVAGVIRAHHDARDLYYAVVSGNLG